MSSTRLNPLDAAWIMTESHTTPDHVVGGFLIFQLPGDAPREFMRRMMRDLRSHRGFSAPWNRRLK
jgi:diacylglycerol O-acyltransferase